MGNLVLSDRSLHFHSEGHGEAVVFVHGLGANHAFWYLGIARHLSKRYQVLTYDLRGHGRSSMPRRGYRLMQMAEDLDALNAHLGIERAHLVGHSFGARVALYYAITRQERVATLTVADTQLRSLQAPMRLGEWPHWPRWRRDLLDQGYDSASLPQEDEVINFRLLARFNTLNRSLAQEGLGLRKKKLSVRRRDMGHRGAARWERLIASDVARGELDDERPLSGSALRQIQVPTLGVFGEYSHCLPTGQQLGELLPRYRLLVVPGVGHFHPAIKPRAFTRVLSVFLSRNRLTGRRSVLLDVTHHD